MVPPPPAPAYSLGTRQAQLERMRRESFDVLVAGGGITGAGVAWDAAAREVRVALIERYGAHYPTLGEPLEPGEPFLKAEALFAARHEQAMTIGDVLGQRLCVSILTKDHGMSAAGTVADLPAREYRWDAGRQRDSPSL